MLVALSSGSFGFCSEPPPPVGSGGGREEVKTLSNTVPDSDSIIVPGTVTRVVTEVPAITVALVKTCTGTVSRTTSLLTGESGEGVEAEAPMVVVSVVAAVSAGELPGAGAGAGVGAFAGAGADAGVTAGMHRDSRQRRVSHRHRPPRRSRHA